MDQTVLFLSLASGIIPVAAVILGDQKILRRLPRTDTPWAYPAIVAAYLFSRMLIGIAYHMTLQFAGFLTKFHDMVPAVSQGTLFVIDIVFWSVIGSRIHKLSSVRLGTLTAASLIEGMILLFFAMIIPAVALSILQALS